MNEVIIPRQTGDRIDKYLTTHFPYSRNFFHHIITRGGVRITQTTNTDFEQATPTKKSYKIKPGDIILIDNLERYTDGTILDEAPQIEIPIIRETRDYLIIRKPKGVLSHPNSIRDVASPSVSGRLHHHYVNLPSIGHFIRAGLVHRLDKDTDGLMMIAKTERGLAHFKQLFQAKSTADTIPAKEAVPLRKYYRATCQITTQGQTFIDTITNYPHYISETVIPKVPHPVPKHGITKILSIDTTTNTETLATGRDDITGRPPDQCISLHLEILTGRTHQIRYHLSTHGLPILGDYLYGRAEKYPMQLTAYQLQFACPNDNNIITIAI